MSASFVVSINTKRIVLAQVSLCCGCCCGAVHKGKPEVPVEWIKDQWKQCGLKKSIQLTISGCLGPCDISNVVSISSAGQTVWLGRLREFANYAALLQWALASKDAGCALPLPGELSELRFDPFHRADSVAAVPSVVESAV
jgi:cobaltochelatase CobN